MTVTQVVEKSSPMVFFPGYIECLSHRKKGKIKQRRSKQPQDGKNVLRRFGDATGDCEEGLPSLQQGVVTLLSPSIVMSQKTFVY